MKLRAKINEHLKNSKMTQNINKSKKLFIWKKKQDQ